MTQETKTYTRDEVKSMHRMSNAVGRCDFEFVTRTLHRADSLAGHLDGTYKSKDGKAVDPEVVARVQKELLANVEQYQKVLQKAADYFAEALKGNVAEFSDKEQKALEDSLEV